MRPLGLAFPLLLALAGCTAGPAMQYWARPGGSGMTFDATKAFCATEAFNHVPPVLPGYPSPLVTKCVAAQSGANCFVAGVAYVPRPGPSDDASEMSRENTFNSCMVSAGWRAVHSAGEGEAVERSVPPPSPAPAAAVRKGRVFCEAIFSRRRNDALVAKFQGNFDLCVATRVHEMHGS